jgi:hypothetical protein
MPSERICEQARFLEPVLERSSHPSLCGSMRQIRTGNQTCSERRFEQVTGNRPLRERSKQSNAGSARN